MTHCKRVGHQVQEVKVKSVIDETDVTLNAQIMISEPEEQKHEQKSCGPVPSRNKAKVFSMQD